jgi:hypothetical protein
MKNYSKTYDIIFVGLLFILTYCIGITLWILNLYNNGVISNLNIFLGILLSNTLVISYIILKTPVIFIEKINELENRNYSSEDKLDIKDLLSYMYNPILNTLVGLIFGSLFFITLNKVQFAESFLENLLLKLFVTVSNVLTGYAISLLIRYYKYTIPLWKNTSIGIWRRNSKVIQFILFANKLFLSLVVFICVMAIISLRFSIFYNEILFTLFSIWTLSFLLITLLLPLLPLSTRLRKLKLDYLLYYGDLIEHEIESIRINKTEYASKIVLIKELNSIYDEISKVRIFPPLGVKTLKSGIIITIVTLTPSVIDLIIKLSRS